MLILSLSLSPASLLIHISPCIGPLSYHGQGLQEGKHYPEPMDSWELGEDEGRAMGWGDEGQTWAKHAIKARGMRRGALSVLYKHNYNQRESEGDSPQYSLNIEVCDMLVIMC